MQFRITDQNEAYTAETSLRDAGYSTAAVMTQRYGDDFYVVNVDVEDGGVEGASAIVRSDAPTASVIPPQ